MDYEVITHKEHLRPAGWPLHVSCEWRNPHHMGTSRGWNYLKSLSLELGTWCN